MKKIVLATGVLALGLFASCSNDAPIVNPDQSEIEGDVRYIAIKVAANVNTRAESGDRYEGDREEKVIDSATLYLIDSENNVTMGRTFNVGFDGNSSETTISFPVEAHYFETLTANAGKTDKKYKLYIIANAAKNGYVMNTFDADAIVKKSTWGDSDNKARPGYFYMSNDEEIEVSLPAYDAASETQNGSSDAKAWVLNVNAADKVVLTRLAARFDLKLDGAGYTYTINEAGDEAKFDITGAGLQHINTESYLFRHMSPSGKADDAVVFGRGGHLVTPHGSWYGQECRPMKSCSYVTDLTDYTGAEAKKFNYGFESAVDGMWTSSMSEEETKALISYKNVTYMAFRAEFTYPGWTDGVKKFFVYNGEIVGTLDEVKNQDFVPYGMSDENRPYVVNTLNALRGTDGSGITVEVLRKNGFDYFEPENGKYLCYYVTPIFNDVDDPEGLAYCCKYRVRRNRLYNMDLEEIRRIGHDGDFVPDPILVDETKWIDLNVSIKDWQIVNNSFVF